MSYKHFDADKTQLNSPGNAPSNAPAGTPTTPAGETRTEKPGLLKGVSFTQILATSLAAVTAFVLSNQIGIAGSIIGVAVGAAASALASQIYQNVIRRSTHSFRNSENDQVDNSYSDVDSTLPAYPYADQIPVDVTQQMPQYAAEQQRYAHTAQNAYPSAPLNRTPKLSRKRIRALTIVTIISIIFTISAVILYAMFLSYITDGSGLGPKVSTTPVVTEKTTDTSNSTDKKDDSNSSSEKTDESSKSTDSKDSTSESTDSKKSETTSSDSSSSSEKTSDSSSSSSSSESNSSSNNSGTGSSNSNSGSNQNSGSGNSSDSGSSGSGSNSSNGGN